MSGSNAKRGIIPGAEDVNVGDESSRVSQILFFHLCLIPVFSTILFGGVDNTTWIFIAIFWALVILLWLAEAWRADGLLFDTSPMQLPLIGFLVIGLIQLLPLGGGTDGVLAVQASQALSLDPYSTRFFLVKIAVYAVFFGACLAFINSERRLTKVVYLVIIFGSLMAFFGILQRLANPEGIYGMRQTVGAIPFGPFVNQHHFATFMQMTGGLALGLLFGKKASKERRILLATAVIVMGVATVLTSSRGGLLGFVAVVAFVTVLNFLSGRWAGAGRPTSDLNGGTQRKVAVAAAGIALIIIIFGTVLLIGGNESLMRGIGAAKADADLSSGRSHFWPIAIHIFLEHPILGAGFEAFGVAFTKHDTMSGQFRVEQAHNEYLQTLADAGIAGFICLAAFIYFLFRKGLGTIVSSVGFRREAAIGSLAGCLGVLIHSFFDFPLRTPSNAFFFLLLCAVATVSISAGDTLPIGRHGDRSK